MRESIGGTWLFGIVITFIALFSAFLSYAISYTKAFNMKSEILNLIERAEGYTFSDGDVKSATHNFSTDNSVEAQAFLLIKSMGYNYISAENADCERVGHESLEGKDAMQAGGYCITRYSSNVKTGVADDGTEYLTCGDDGVYYKVTTFISVTLPVVNLTFSIPVSGETRTLFFDYGDNQKLGCFKGGY